MKIQIVFFLSFFYLSVTGQNLADTIPLCKNAVSLEVVGSSCNIISIHFDRIIKKNRKHFYSANVGLGYMPSLSSYNSNQVIGISMAIDWNNNLYKKSHMVGGIALTYSDGFFQTGFADQAKDSYKILYASLRLGYKFQKATKGLFLKIMATPVFKIYEFSNLAHSAPSIFPLVGLGVGYSF